MSKSFLLVLFPLTLMAGGALVRVDRDGRRSGECPLRHTDVKVNVSAMVARVDVTQQFENTAPDAIEAVYLFPLSARAAVDEMTIRIGDRVIRSTIQTRERAQAIYREARQAGRTAALLDQERPNIFRQAIANLAPHAKVEVHIRYVEALQYDHGGYDFRFPMVVAPRYGGAMPNVTPPGTRAGHDISLEALVDAGMAVEAVECPSHEVTIQRRTGRVFWVGLKNQRELPNRDFILKYHVAGRMVRDAVMAHRGPRGGFFSLVLQPPARVEEREIAPKELIFVLDTSGSMSGFPIEKAKEAMQLALNGMGPRDTFNLITFSGDTHILFPAPVPANEENLRRAKQFLQARSGSGGTEMMKAIRAALAPSGDGGGRVRVVCFMTDGEVGNDAQIIEEVKRSAGARVFAFGIGNSVNHYLLDSMARFGRGEVEYVGLSDDGAAAARRFHERVRHPLLTDVEIDWNGLPVSEVYPRRIPDLFDAKPVVVLGRYTGTVNGTVRLRGRMAGREFVRELKLSLPAEEPRHDVLATLWARTKVADSTNREEITKLGLEFRLMTQYTSFVAVDDRAVVENGRSRRVEVPVEMPDGMRYEGVFGDRISVSSAALAIGGTPSFLPGPKMMRRVEEAPSKPEKVEKLDQAVLQANQANGVLTLRVLLAGANAEALVKLKAVGFEITRQSGAMVWGRIAANRLHELVKLEAVRWVALP